MDREVRAANRQEGALAGRSEIISRMKRVNTGHVAANVMITETISMERSNRGVGW